ncbi:hypothetical protein ACZ87_02483, partial [Candidatus Erwinia dacicola]
CWEGENITFQSGGQYQGATTMQRQIEHTFHHQNLGNSHISVV